MSDRNLPDVIPPARAFNSYLAAIDGGRFHATISNLFRDLIKAMDERHHPGQNVVKGDFKITLKMTLKGGILELQPKIDIKAPEDPQPRSIFWITAEHGLTVQNPAQLEMPLRNVAGDDDELRTVHQ